MKTVKIICGAYGQRVNGRTVPVRMGGTCRVDDQEAARLVGLKAAVYVEEAPAAVPVQEGELSQEGVPPQEDETVPKNAPDKESEPFSRDELDDMTKDSLLKVASQLGLEANIRMSKADILQAIHGALTHTDESVLPNLAPEDPVI